jgi:ferritin-like metal-binding protein YciE
VEELKDIYSAENQLLKALPKMAKAASSDELRSAFEEHLEETRVHVERTGELHNTRLADRSERPVRPENAVP